MSLGSPRLHLRQTSSTNQRARELAAAGAPHGALVTAAEQTAGRGRQGRRWVAPPGQALLCSLLLREPPRLLPLAAGAAVAEVVEKVMVSATMRTDQAQIKWPNDVLVNERKVAGILVEGRPQERWAVLGIGINVAVDQEAFPPELQELAGTLGRSADEVESVLAQLLDTLARWLAAGEGAMLGAVRERDALAGRPVRWANGEGIGAGIDGDGRLIVSTAAGRVALEAGEVHLRRDER